MQALLGTLAAGSVMATNIKGSVTGVDVDRGLRSVSRATEASTSPAVAQQKQGYASSSSPAWLLPGATLFLPSRAVSSLPCWLQPRGQLPPGLPALTPQQRNERTGRWGEELVFQYCQWQLGAFHATARPDTFRSAHGWQVGRGLAEVQDCSVECCPESCKVMSHLRGHVPVVLLAAHGSGHVLMI